MVQYPSLYWAASEISQESQKRFFLLRGTEFTSLVLAAIFAEIPAEAAAGFAPAASLFFFLGALGVRLSGAGDSQEELWYEARAAAESIKSSSWQFAVGGEAYRVSDEDARSRFTESLRDIMSDLPRLDVPARSTRDFGVTGEMSNLRGKGLRHRIDAYMEGRVRDQLDWYSKKADFHRSRAGLWNRTLIGIEVVAVALGLVRVLGVVGVDWLGLLATVGAAVAAWQQTKNHSFLSESYSVTSHEVNIIADTLGAETDEEAWAQAVHDAEAAFSREHTLWKARRQGPPTP